jgi:glycolate oxidase
MPCADDDETFEAHARTVTRCASSERPEANVANEFVTNEEIVRAARRRLPQDAWDYLVGGSESETTLRRNRLAFDRIAFRPRTLIDVSTIDPSATVAGHNLRIPVFLAPMGSLQTFTPDGGAASTRAAAEFGTLHVVSSVTEPGLQAIAEAVDYPKVYQLYIRGDWSWVEEQIALIKSARYTGFCLTVDTAVQSHRDRVNLTQLGRVVPTNQRDPKPAASMTWEALDRIKDAIGLPFMVKGIATAEDAAIAVEHGVDVVWVSNHGGRQLDHGRGAMDTLPEIVAAVDGKAEVVLDGGIQRGTDVIKAVALGAKAVAIGKLQGWGLAANGQAGLVRVLEILEEEVRIAMGLLGITCMDELTPDHLCAAEPVTTPHEMSAWVNMPGGRIQ